MKVNEKEQTHFTTDVSKKKKYNVAYKIELNIQVLERRRWS